MLEYISHPLVLFPLYFIPFVIFLSFFLSFFIHALFLFKFLFPLPINYF